mgnify:CR=1 FL=1
MRIRQNRRYPPHRLKQNQQFPKKPDRPMSKPPQNDSQSQLSPRTLCNTKAKRL